MSTEVVTIDGIDYEPSAIVAKRFGYTLDYVSRLAREKKIMATQVERRWYVVSGSLATFVEETKEKRRLQNEAVRAERKLAIMLQEEKDVSHVVTDNKIPADVKNPHTTIETNKKTNILLAVGGTNLVMIAGLLVALVSNPQFVTSVLNDSGTIQRGTLSSAASVVGYADTERSFTIDSRFRRENAATHGMIVFAESSTTSTSTIERSFSDEVHVHFKNSNTGVVQPEFKSGLGDEYVFVIVPTDPS